MSHPSNLVHVNHQSTVQQEKYEEVEQEKIQFQSDVDQCETYYQAAGGENKRRIYGLGSEIKSYYGTSLCASSSVPTLISQSAPISNLDEFVIQLIPALTNHFSPIIMKRIGGGTGSGDTYIA